MTCDGGIQVRSVTCTDNGGNVVSTNNCPGAMPDVQQPCGLDPCAEFVVGEWSNVSKYYLIIAGKVMMLYSSD